MNILTNHYEDRNFLKTALKWKGSVSPRVVPRVLAAMLFSELVVYLAQFFDKFSVPITPFEYSGAVLGLLLVVRLNAGLDRWWEARKVWGSIVNQCRNLVIITTSYGKVSPATKQELVRWVAAWPHVMRESLRRESQLVEVTKLLGAAEASKVRASEHMPLYVAQRIGGILHRMRGEGLDDFAFQRAERERALLVDAIGMCERIRNTPLPLVLAIKTRRFILLFLLLLPFALIDRAESMTPLVVSLAAYPLFSLDEIGVELQNPFSPRNLSHLPLEEICSKIEANLLGLEAPTEQVA